MSVSLPIIVFGGGLVGLRMLRGKLQKVAYANLSRNEASKLWLPKAELEVSGKLDDLPLIEPSFFSALTHSILLVRMPAPGKTPVVELTCGWRRIRRLCAMRSKGPVLSLTVVPSPSDLINLATAALLAVALGLLFSPVPVFWAGMALLVAEETWIRLRIPTESVKTALEKAIAGKG
jgi:hypothetical protein